MIWNRTLMQVKKQPSQQTDKQRLFLAQLKPSIQISTMLRSRRIRANERVGLSSWGDRLNCQHHQRKCLSNHCPSHFRTLLSKNTQFFMSMNIFHIQTLHLLLCLSKGQRSVHYTATFTVWKRCFQPLKFCISLSNDMNTW